MALPAPVRSLDEISASLQALAERLESQVAEHAPVALDAQARWTLTQAVHDLERHVPGLYAFGHPAAAVSELAASQEALAQGDPGEALVRALHGLAFAPHHPELHYAAAAAAVENGAVVEAVMLLRHTLWIKPSHAGALADLSAMFATGILEAGGAAASNDGACRPGPAGEELRFESADPDAREEQGRPLPEPGPDEGREAA